MGILDWITQQPWLGGIPYDADTDREWRRAHDVRQAHFRDEQARAVYERAIGPHGLSHWLTPAPTWQHTIRIGPPPETHKHRMARLIARRERSGR